MKILFYIVSLICAIIGVISIYQWNIQNGRFYLIVSILWMIHAKQYDKN
jgi:nitrogen fixation-related uncharacterized protein